MDTQSSMFPLEEFEPGSPPLPDEENHCNEERVPGDGGGRAGIGAERQEDGLETTADTEQRADVPEEASVPIAEQAEGEEPDPIYQRTGLKGPFQLSPLALIFPDALVEDLAANIKAHGLLEEITAAGDPPLVIDGKRRLKASPLAGVEPRYRLLRGGMDPRAYVWAKNGERRDLSKSQKALAFAELFPNWHPGRPPKIKENCRISDNSPPATQGEAAKARSISRQLVSGAVKLVNSDVPELTEAVRQDVITLNDALNKDVLGAPREVQRQALALVRSGAERTASAAVAKVQEESSEQGDEHDPEADPPTTFGENATFHSCSVADLRKRLQPGTADLIVACPPPDARLNIFTDLGALANHVLSKAGVMVVAMADTGRQPEVLSRLLKEGLEWIMELSLLFPAPIATSGEPHWIDIRRVALLVSGKSQAELKITQDVIEAPGPVASGEADALAIEDGMELIVNRFASPGQVVCIPMLQGASSMVVAALKAGCTVIGADEDQSCIDLVLEQLRGAMLESQPSGQEDLRSE